MWSHLLSFWCYCGNLLIQLSKGYCEDSHNAYTRLREHIFSCILHKVLALYYNTYANSNVKIFPHYDLFHYHFFPSQNAINIVVC